MNESLIFIDFTGTMGIICLSVLWLFGWEQTRKHGGKFFWDFPRDSANIEGMDMIFVGLVSSALCIVLSIQFLITGK